LERRRAECAWIQRGKALGREYSMVFTPEEIEAGEPRREMEEAARTGHCTTESWRVRRDGSLFCLRGAHRGSG